MKFDILNGYNLISTVTLDGDYATIVIHTDDTNLHPFGEHTKVSALDVMEYLESRIFPRNRSDVNELLDEIGVDFYDPEMIIRKGTHGVIMEDDEWVRFEDENLTFDDIKRMFSSLSVWKHW